MPADTTLGVQGTLLREAMEICPCEWEEGDWLHRIAYDDDGFWCTEEKLPQDKHWKHFEVITNHEATALLEKAMTAWLVARGCGVATVPPIKGGRGSGVDGATSIHTLGGRLAACSWHTLTALCEAVVELHAKEMG